MKNIIFIAPPAAGKGTVSARICDKYNIPHISTGDLLRDEIKNSTKLGLEIKDAMARGEFVSDEVITKLLIKRLSYLTLLLKFYNIFTTLSSAEMKCILM